MARRGQFLHSKKSKFRKNKNRKSSKTKSIKNNDHNKHVSDICEIASEIIRKGSPSKTKRLKSAAKVSMFKENNSACNDIKVAMATKSDDIAWNMLMNDVFLHQEMHKKATPADSISKAYRKEKERMSKIVSTEIGNTTDLQNEKLSNMFRNGLLNDFIGNAKNKTDVQNENIRSSNCNYVVCEEIKPKKVKREAVVSCGNINSENKVTVCDNNNLSSKCVIPGVEDLMSVPPGVKLFTHNTDVAASLPTTADRNHPGNGKWTIGLPETNDKEINHNTDNISLEGKAEHENNANTLTNVEVESESIKCEVICAKTESDESNIVAEVENVNNEFYNIDTKTSKHIEDCLSRSVELKDNDFAFVTDTLLTSSTNCINNEQDGFEGNKKSELSIDKVKKENLQFEANKNKENQLKNKDNSFSLKVDLLSPFEVIGNQTIISLDVESKAKDGDPEPLLNEKQNTLILNDNQTEIVCIENIVAKADNATEDTHRVITVDCQSQNAVKSEIAKPEENQPTITVDESAKPKVDAALAELDSIPEGVCEAVDEEEEEEDEWAYYRMESQTQQQGDDILTTENLNKDNTSEGNSPPIPGSPRSVEGFVTSVELNTPEESYNTNLPINQSNDIFHSNVEQSSGPFSVYVSSSPEPGSLDPPTQNLSEVNAPASPQPDVDAPKTEEPTVEIVHAQSTVEVVAPPSPVAVIESDFTTIQQQESVTEVVSEQINNTEVERDQINNTEVEKDQINNTEVEKDQINTMEAEKDQINNMDLESEQINNVEVEGNDHYKMDGRNSPDPFVEQTGATPFVCVYPLVKEPMYPMDVPSPLSPLAEPFVPKSPLEEPLSPVSSEIEPIKNVEELNSPASDPLSPVPISEPSPIPVEDNGMTNADLLSGNIAELDPLMNDLMTGSISGQEMFDALIESVPSAPITNGVSDEPYQFTVTETEVKVESSDRIFINEQTPVEEKATVPDLIQVESVTEEKLEPVILADVGINIVEAEVETIPTEEVLKMNAVNEISNHIEENGTANPQEIIEPEQPKAEDVKAPTPAKKTLKSTPGKATKTTPADKLTKKPTPKTTPIPRTATKVSAAKPTTAKTTSTTTKPAPKSAASTRPSTAPTRPATSSTRPVPASRTTTTSARPATTSTRTTTSTTTRTAPKPSTRPATAPSARPTTTRTAPAARTTTTSTTRTTTTTAKPTAQAKSATTTRAPLARKPAPTTTTRPAAPKPATNGVARKPMTKTENGPAKPTLTKTTRTTTSTLGSRTTATKAPLRSKPATAEKDLKNTTNKMLSTARTKTTTTTTRSPTTRITKTGTSTVTKSKSATKSVEVTKTAEVESTIENGIVNGENKIVEEECSVEVKEKLVEDIETKVMSDVTESIEKMSIAEQIVENSVETIATEVLVNGNDH